MDSGRESFVQEEDQLFRKKIGDEISPEAVQKGFALGDSFAKNQFQQLMTDIPAEKIEWIKQVVELTEDELEVEFSPNIYLALTDHLHYTITRARENTQLPNLLLFGTRRFYPREHQAAKEALLLVEQGAGVGLSRDEAGFIAFHFVNSQQGNEDMQVTMAATTMVRGTLSIISRFFDIVFDEESLNYQRIITHLQLFAQRYLRGEGSDEQDEFLYALVQGKYPKAFYCVRRINEYLRRTQKQEIGIAEQIYLAIHI